MSTTATATTTTPSSPAQDPTINGTGQKKQKIVKKDLGVSKKVQAQKGVWRLGHLVCLVFGVLYALAYLYHIFYFIGYCFTFYKYRNWRYLFLAKKADYVALLHSLADLELKKYKEYGWFDYKFYLHYLLCKRFLFNPSAWYRLSCLGSLVAHTVTLDQQTNSKFMSLSYYDLFSMVNFQYLAIVLLWSVTYPSLFKLFPYLVISFVQFTGKTGDKKLTAIIPYAEIFTLVPLFVNTILLTQYAGFVFVGYLAVFWIKVNFNGYTQFHILKVFKLLDKKIPKKFDQKWSAVKQFILIKLSEKYKQRKEFQTTAKSTPKSAKSA